MNSRRVTSTRVSGCGSPERMRRRCGYLIFTSTFWLITLAIFAFWSLSVVAEQPPVRPAAPTDLTTPAVEEWLNQTVRLRQTAQAMSRPASEGKSLGEIHTGAEVKAIGLVAGRQWVKIELPDHSQAYIPREAIEYETNPGEPRQPAGVQDAVPPTSATGASPSSTGSTAAPPQAGEATGPQTASVAAPNTIRGKVTRVPNAATLVVGDQRIRLSGIDPGPIEDLGPFDSWVRGEGELVCTPEAQTGRYRCLTGNGVDVAQAAILNGTGRVGDGALPEYRDSETQARQTHRGLWQGP
jgi:endonuclease YncB( thermonuclease family)